MQVEGGNRAAGSLPVAVRARNEHDGTVIALDEAGGDDPDHAFVPIRPRNGIRAAGSFRRRPLLDLGHRLAEDASLDGLALPVQLLERVGQPPRICFVLCEQELECLVRMPEASGGIQAWSVTEPDGPGVDRSWIDAGALHECAKAGFRSAREGAKPGNGERPILVYERDYVGDGRQCDEVEVPPRYVGVDPEEGLPHLVDHPGSAEFGERIRGV